MKRTIIALVAIVSACAPPAPGKWGPSGCTAAELVNSYVQAEPAPPEYRWLTSTVNKDQIDLINKATNRSVGAFFIGDGVYHSYSWATNKWGKPGAPPIDPPAGVIPRFGVDPSKMSGYERYTVDGHDASGADLKSLLAGAGSLDDVTKLRHLSFVGKDAATKKRLEENAAPDLAELCKTYRVQFYDSSRAPDREMLAPFLLEVDQSFQEKGAAVYLQEPDQNARGRAVMVLYGVPTAAELTGGLRKADPNWRPLPKPVPPTPPTPPTPTPPKPPDGPAPKVEIPPQALLIGALVAAIAGMGYAGSRRKT